MPHAGFKSLIARSFGRMVLILFKPFSYKKWAKLILIAYLAGCLGFGGSSSSRGSSSKGRRAEAARSEQVLGLESQDPAKGSFPAEEPLFLDGPQKHGIAGDIKEALSFLPDWFFRYFSVILVLGLGLVILFTWLSARFQFVWYRAVVDNDAKIAEPFQTYKTQGNSLFQFYLIAYAVGAAVIALAAYWAWSRRGAFPLQGEAQISPVEMIKLYMGPFFVVLLVVLLGSVLFFFVQHLVLPIMAEGNCLFREGWRKFSLVYQSRRPSIWLFLIVSVGLGIVGGLATVLLSFLVLFILGIAAFLVLGFIYLLLTVLFKAKILFWIVAIILGVPYLLASILILTATHLPLAVFFRSFSLYFLSNLNCGICPLPLEESDAGDA